VGSNPAEDDKAFKGDKSLWQDLLRREIKAVGPMS
jgi:hypothetical protein